MVYEQNLLSKVMLFPHEQLKDQELKLKQLPTWENGTM